MITASGRIYGDYLSYDERAEKEYLCAVELLNSSMQIEPYSYGRVRRK